MNKDKPMQLIEIKSMLELQKMDVEALSKLEDDLYRYRNKVLTVERVKRYEEKEMANLAK